MDQIGKYKILSHLGQGGMARVYHALDPFLGRNVAIKILVDAVNPKDQARLRAEAKALGRLRHPNVLSIIDLEVIDGTPVLVMELLEGQDLEHYAPTGTQLPLLEAVEIMHQAAMGLHHAHSHGIIHRDVSPSNIWLQPDHGVKVIDFGIAVDTQSVLTQTSAAGPLGTVLYFSPEHLADPPVELGPKSDIFSFGIVFYQLLAGRHPFGGGSDQETLSSIMAMNPEPLVKARTDCPRPLANLIHRALRKDLDLRYPSFQELLADLDPIMLELRAPEAQRLFEQARQEHASGNLDAARGLLARVIRLVPGRQDALALQSAIRQQQETEKIKAKVAALQDEAGRKLQDRKFRDAVAILSRAQQLDESSVDVSNLLDEARGSLDRFEKANGLVRRAEEHRTAGRLHDALQSAKAALEADHGNTAATRLALTVQNEIEVERTNRLARELARARQLLSEEQFLAATLFLEALAHEFPGDAKIPLLIAYARNEAATREKQRVIENARREAVRHAAFGKVDLAMRAVDHALDLYPEDSELMLLRISLVNQQQTLSQTHVRRAAPGGGSRSSSSGTMQCVCGNVLALTDKFCDKCGRAQGA